MLPNCQMAALSVGGLLPAGCREMATQFSAPMTHLGQWLVHRFGTEVGCRSK
jgi:hypothetical protein